MTMLEPNGTSDVLTNHDEVHAIFNLSHDADLALLTIDEVARYLRVSVGTVRK